MFTFAYPGHLFYVLLIPAFILLYILSRYIRNKRIKSFGNPEVLNLMMQKVSPYKPIVRLVLSLIALFAIIFAFARPWGGVKSQETTREGIEIVIAVDASNSMLASATDKEGGPDRMRMAKLTLEKLINKLGNDRVGLIAYAGDAYTLIPVTNDYVSAKAFLNSIDPSLIPHQGTNIGAAISLAEKSFSNTSDIGKAIVLLTDAEELENPEGTIAEVKNAAKRGIQTDVIGIGSSPVTIPSDTQGRMIDEETGEVVHTALNEDLAINIAKAGNGIYVNAYNDDAIDELLKRLGNLKKAAMESSFQVSHDELYFPFVILALVFLICDFLLTDKKNSLLSKWSFFSKKTLILLSVVSINVLVSSCAKNETNHNEQSTDPTLTRRDSLLTIYSLERERDFILQGNEFYRQGYLPQADSLYTEALKENPRSLVANLNLGLTTLREIVALEQSQPEGQLPDSIMEPLFNKATGLFRQSANPYIEKGNISSMAFYNLGNMEFTQKRYGSSIENYKEALRLNPNDDHARRNLRIAQLQKEDNEQNQNQQDQQQDQQQDNQQQENNKEEQETPQDRQQINQQTSDQILEAAERKENERRARMQTEKQESTDKSGRSLKKW